MMNAETLRRAAALMRERATSAALGTDDPWYGHPDTVSLGVSQPDAEYIASWHPAVALAVADWLEAAARRMPDDCDCAECLAYEPEALVVARAYLGEG